jgi:hypothetical protein
VPLLILPVPAIALMRPTAAGPLTMGAFAMGRTRLGWTLRSRNQ